MKTLYEKLKKYSLEDAKNIEKSDRQFLALQSLEKRFKDKEIFLALIISNAIICYQLSGT
jgi:N-glycosylase/DNA lyase